MPEATRRLLYQLNSRWIYGKIVSSPASFCLCAVAVTLAVAVAVAVAARTAAHMHFVLLSLRVSS